jgi:hemerythrin superfamily protein
MDMALGEASAGRRDAVEFLMEEHASVERLFAEYQRLPEMGMEDRRRSLVAQMLRDLKLHAAMEEQSFYPSVREVIAEGDRLVNEALEEHQQAKQQLAELEWMSATEPGYDAKVETLIRDVRHHVNEEEGEVLPRLQRAVGESWLVELGDELRQAKQRLGEEAIETTSALVEPLPPVLTPEGPPSMREPSAAKPTPRRTARRKAAAKRSPAARSAATTTKRSGSSQAKKATGGRARVTRTVYRVTPTKDGRWQVTKKGATRASSTHDKKSEAVSRGRQFARKHRLAQLVVHTSAGKIQTEYTYGEDPRRSRG